MRVLSARHHGSPLTPDPCGMREVKLRMFVFTKFLCYMYIIIYPFIPTETSGGFRFVLVKKYSVPSDSRYGETPAIFSWKNHHKNDRNFAPLQKLCIVCIAFKFVCLIDSHGFSEYLSQKAIVKFTYSYNVRKKT